MQTPSLADLFQTKPAVNKAGKADATLPIGPSFDATFLGQAPAKPAEMATDPAILTKDGANSLAVNSWKGLSFLPNQEEANGTLVITKQNTFGIEGPVTIAGLQNLKVSPDQSNSESLNFFEDSGEKIPLPLGAVEQNSKRITEMGPTDPKPVALDLNSRMDGKSQATVITDNVRKQAISNDGIHPSQSDKMTAEAAQPDLDLSLGVAIHQTSQLNVPPAKSHSTDWPILNSLALGPSFGLVNKIEGTSKSATIQTDTAAITPDKNAISGAQIAASSLDSRRQSGATSPVDTNTALPPLIEMSTNPTGLAAAQMRDDMMIERLAGSAIGQGATPPVPSDPGPKEPVSLQAKEQISIPSPTSPGINSSLRDQPLIGQVTQGLLDVDQQSATPQPMNDMRFQSLGPVLPSSDATSKQMPDNPLNSIVSPEMKSPPATERFGANSPNAKAELTLSPQTPASGDTSKVLPPNSPSQSLNALPQASPIPGGVTTTYHISLGPPSSQTPPTQTPLLPAQQIGVSAPGVPSDAHKVYSPSMQPNAVASPPLQVAPITVPTTKEGTVPVAPPPTPATPVVHANSAATLQSLVANPAIQPLLREERALGDGKELTSFGMSHHILDAPVLNTSRPASDAQIGRQVVQQLIEVANLAPNRPVEIALNPEELGRVRMTLHPSDGGMQVSLVADRPETTELLRRNIEMLANEFRELGYTSISFTFSGSDSGRDGAMTSGGKADPDLLQESPDHPNPTPIRRSIPLNGGVDLRL